MTTALNNKKNTKKKIATILFLIFVLSSVAHLGWFYFFPKLKTSILELLPATEKTPATAAAFAQISSKMSGRAVLLVESKNILDAIDAADQIASLLDKRKDVVSEVTCAIESNQHQQFYDFYFSARWLALSPKNRELVKLRHGESIVENAKVKLFSMVTGVSGDVLVQDPFFLFSDLTSTMSQTFSAFEVHQNHLVVKKGSRQFVLVAITGKGDIFGADASANFVNAVNDAIESARLKHHVRNVYWTGMVKYAAATAAQAKTEISLIGLGSLIGVVILLVLAFGSFRELAYGVVPIGVGIAWAILGTVLFFGHIHILTLVFGASLVGVCIDYSFHFFSHRLFSASSSMEVLKAVFPGITLGLCTSLLGYFALLIAPFPGLQQMAVFAGIGLLGAYLTVVFLFPMLPFAKRHVIVQRKIVYADWLVRYVNYFSPKLKWILLGITVLASFGIFRLHADDDVRLLRGTNSALESEEQFISALVRSFDQSRFVVLWADSAQALAQKEEKLVQQLEPLEKKGSFDGLAASIQMVPSQKRQERNRRFFQQFLQTDAVQKYFDMMGLSPQNRATLLSSIEQSKPVSFQQFQQANISPLHAGLRFLVPGGKFGSMVLFKRVLDATAIKDVCKKFDGVTYVDKVGDISSLFSQYRTVASWLLAGAYGVILIFLILRYGWRKGVAVILPPFMTAILLLGAMGFAQVNVNIFTFFGLLVVLAIGIDYTLFFAESAQLRPTIFAIGLSVLTTMLSFGLMSLSQNPGLRVFGITMLFGILLAGMLSPLGRIGWKHDSQ